jgi:hypothetical protein
MAITPKELMQPPKFEGLGKFVYARPGNGEWAPNFVFEVWGGQVSVEVSESESANPPMVDTVFRLSGHVRHNGRNGTVALVATLKERLPDFSPEEFVKGLNIAGVGVVEAKSSTVMNRQTFWKVTLKWQGATHEFRKLSPELYQRIPGAGSYCRFGLGMLVRSERNLNGQMIVLQEPSLASIQVEEISTGSVSAAPPPAKPAAAAPAAKV